MALKENVSYELDSEMSGLIQVDPQRWGSEFGVQVCVFYSDGSLASMLDLSRQDALDLVEALTKIVGA